jgi:hypothetical protein
VWDGNDDVKRRADAPVAGSTVREFDHDFGNDEPRQTAPVFNLGFPHHVTDRGSIAVPDRAGNATTVFALARPEVCPEPLYRRSLNTAIKTFI